MKTVQDYLPTQFWLMKTEPSVFSFDDLEKKQSEFWDGVRNYQARNLMQQNMQVGHKVLFYHSNATPTGIAGVCGIIAPAAPDVSALNPKSDFYDAKATKENPRWFGVTVGKPVRFKKFVTLEEMRHEPKLKEMLLLRKGQRLSIQPVSKEEFNIILELGGISLVRLPKAAIELIRSNVKNSDSQSEVYIIGSRADPFKKGGDIDILILSKVFSFEDRRNLSFALEDMLGEQKIDIAVYKDKSAPFVQVALAKSVQL